MGWGGERGEGRTVALTMGDLLAGLTAFCAGAWPHSPEPVALEAALLAEGAVDGAGVSTSLPKVPKMSWSSSLALLPPQAPSCTRDAGSTSEGASTLVGLKVPSDSGAAGRGGLRALAEGAARLGEERGKGA